MFRHTKLILAVLLTGCTTQAKEGINPTQETFTPTVIQPNEELLATVEATLGVADGVIEGILKEKIKARDKISTLQQTVNYEESLLENLEGSLGVKDSLLLTYQENNSLLKNRIDKVENDLNHAIHKCTDQCYPKIKELTQENKELLNNIDSLQTWVFYLDSLISTNRRLSKKIK